MVDNGGKIIDKKMKNNLGVLTSQIINQIPVTTKKVNRFLIMTFQYHFSPVLVQLFGGNY